MAARALRLVPQEQEGAVLYIRQSITRGDTVSPVLQESAGRDHCDRTGLRVVAIISDLNRTGRTLKRRKVQEAIGYIERGEAKVIVVWKWSRLSRSRRDFAVSCDAIEGIGGRVESSTEPIDTRTATGRFQRGILAEFAAFESDRTGEIIKEVQDNRVRQGLPGNGKPRFGYLNVGKRFEPDPATSEALASMYRLYIAGTGYQLISRWLNDHGHRTTYGGAWHVETVRSVLESGFGAGLMRHRGELVPGIHTPVITPEEWRQYRAARTERSYMPPRTKGSRYVLSGLVRCGLCPGTMIADRDSRGTVFYRCKYRTQTGCRNGYAMVCQVEAEVRRWLQELVDDVDQAAEAARASAATAVVQRHKATSVARQITDQDAALVQLTVDRARKLVPEVAYAAARDELLATKARLVDELGEAERAQDRAERFDVTAYRGLLIEWDTMPVEARREMLRRILRKVVITKAERSAKRERSLAETLKVDCVPVWV